jgi:3-hydroxyacyl-CoA dehydrogenase
MTDKRSTMDDTGHDSTGPRTQVVVLGAGTMGAGIAQCLADHGRDVTLTDIDTDALKRAQDRIAISRSHLETAGLQTPDASIEGDRRLNTSTDLAESLATADLVIEAVPENIELKCQVFAELDRLAPPHTALVSNTSGLSITTLGQATRRPEQVAGFHWWNPAELVPLVEVTSGDQTDPQLIEQLLELAVELGKQPIHVRRDVPGFVGNRLQFAVFREALHLIEQGVVSPEDLDRAMTGGPGFRWGFLGPLQAADFGGLDVFHSISSYLWQDLSDATTAPAALTDRLDAGRLGTKTQGGFYEYSADSLAELTQRRDRFLLGLKQLVEQTGTPNCLTTPKQTPGPPFSTAPQPRLPGGS